MSQSLMEKRNSIGVSMSNIEDYETTNLLKFRSRHMLYLIFILPVYFITLGITTNYNPVASSDNPNHYAYKFMTMILLAWAWMSSVRLFLYISPVIFIFILQLVRMPVEMMKNYVEHVRSIAIPLARFSMYILMAVYYNAFFTKLKGSFNDPDDELSAVFKILAVLTGLIFIEAIIIRKIGISFHQSAFADRIKVNKLALKTIDKLDKSINASRDLFNIDLSSDSQALHQAKRLFDSVSHGRDVVVMSDFVPYFSSVEEAKEAFTIFDKNGDGDIIKGEMRAIVLQIYEERRALNNSLSDITHAISKLDRILISVCFFVTFFVALAILTSDPVKTIVPFSSFLIGLSFIFGQSARDTFDAILFVFVTHPFDSLDRVYIKGENLVVKELGLLTTTFIRVDGQLVYMPNSVLNKQNIYNIRRSGPQAEAIMVDVSFDTPATKIKELNLKLNEFLALNSRDYDADITVNVIDLENMNKLTLTMLLGFKRNWMDSALRMKLKTKFNLNLKNCLIELGFTYLLPVQPVKRIE
eukprot:NODE_867_length_3586_cov_0.433037.p1 type:complete len:527 gc:universal NODE_867_length_3586_cov_0.433037:1916-336(-)